MGISGRSEDTGDIWESYQAIRYLTHLAWARAKVEVGGRVQGGAGAGAGIGAGVEAGAGLKQENNYLSDKKY